MTDISTLHRRIAALASDPNAVNQQMRELQFDPSQDALDAMICEISETRFQRLLTFKNDRQELLTLHVLSGRILKLLGSMSGDLTDHGALDLIDADQNQKTAFSLVLETFLKDTSSLSVRTAFSDSVANGASIGIVLDRLLFEAGDEGARADSLVNARHVDSFAAQILPLTTAFVRIDGDRISEAKGQEPYLASLLSLAEEEISSHAADHKWTDQAHFVLMGSEPDRGKAALCAALADCMLFVTFATKDIDDVLETWTACCTSDKRAR
ncbi:hypothetical protein N9M66_03270 [Litoreibacter sp.]|nr:hypothetical protein [Litoreibacter sp.]